MKRSRSDTKRLGPAAAAMKRRDVYHDQRTANEQISVDKILADAAAMQRFHAAPRTTGSTRVVIQTEEELALYRQRTRAEMEEKLRRGANALGNWTKYARWEAVQKDFARMRTVMERCVSFHDRNPKFWRDYAELEMENGFVSHAREIWQRAVTMLPSSADLWLKYLLFEQTCGPVAPTSAAAAVPLTSSSSSASSATAPGQRTREVFNRLLNGPVQPAPAWAYEVTALYELRCGRVEACRESLSRYVKDINDPSAWLLYSEVEKNVLLDQSRAIRVLETAIKALPDDLVWGIVECRVVLALTELYREAGRFDDGRRLFTELLQRLQDATQRVNQSLTVVDGGSSKTKRDLVTVSPTSALEARVEMVLNGYSRFERLCAGQRQEQGAGASESAGAASSSAALREELATYSDIASLQARRTFEARLTKNPSDFDAHVSLYLVLRDAYRHPAPGTSTEVCAQRLAAARQQLERAVSVKATDAHSAQQRAVLMMEYARQERLAGQEDHAREILAKGIREFPFDIASCPRLWLEAAALEEQLGNWDQARRLLQSATHVTKDATVFDAALLLEDHALGAASDGEDDEAARARAYTTFLANARRLYQDAIKAFPLDEFRWLQFAKLEESASQEARAGAVLNGCIQSLTAAAAKAPSFSERYDLLSKVDAAWGKQLALQTRLYKRRTRKQTNPDVLEAAEKDVFAVYDRFLRAMWTDYRFEAIAWRTKHVAEVEAEAAREAQAAAAAAAKAAARYKSNNSRSKDNTNNANNGTDGNRPDAAARTTVAASRQERPLIPDTLPSLLGPAVGRWKAAVDAIVARAVQGFGKSSAAKQEASDAEALAAKSSRLSRVRSLFQHLLEDERLLVKRTLLGTNADAASFDETQMAHRWSALILGPLTNAWAAFETVHGGSTESVQEAAPAPVKRRTRLFRSKTE